MGLEAELVEARETFESGKTESFTWRRSQLMALQNLLKEQEGAIFKALKQDLGKHHVEVYRDEVGVLIKSVDYALQNLKKWMAPGKVSVPLAAFPSSAEVVPEPLGLVLVFSSWNYPIGIPLPLPLPLPLESGGGCSRILGDGVHVTSYRFTCTSSATPDSYSTGFCGVCMHPPPIHLSDSRPKTLEVGVNGASISGQFVCAAEINGIQREWSVARNGCKLELLDRPVSIESLDQPGSSDL